MGIIHAKTLSRFPEKYIPENMVDQLSLSELLLKVLTISVPFENDKLKIVSDSFGPIIYLKMRKEWHSVKPELVLAYEKGSWMSWVADPVKEKVRQNLQNVWDENDLMRQLRLEQERILREENLNKANADTVRMRQMINEKW